MGKTSKDKRDIYYRKAKEEGYRARSAYKLKQVDQTFDIFEGVLRVVDLCAAPGSWSQVIVERLKAKGVDITKPHLCSVDLFEIAEIDGATRIQGDITRQKTVEQIHLVFENKAVDLVVSDGAPDILGDHDFDSYVQNQLVMAAFNIAARLLVQGGTFVAKIFRGRDIGILFKEFQRYFGQVYCAKPKSCRNSSIEAFLVAKGFKGAPLQSSNLSNQDLIGQFNHLLNFDKIYYGQEEEETFVPFVACGDDS